MKISKTIQEALNRQINLEQASAHAYLAMAAWFEQRALSGFGRWMRLQSEEETGHAMKFLDYLLDRDGTVQLLAIPEPVGSFDSPLGAFKASQEQERSVTASIYELYDLAHGEKDYATVSMLKWFVDEQVEEEKSVADMVDRLKLAGDRPDALILLDSMAAKRQEET